MGQIRYLFLIGLMGTLFCSLATPGRATVPVQPPAPASQTTVAGLWDVFRVVEDLDDLRDGDFTEITPVEEALRPIESALDSVEEVIDNVQDIANDPVQDQVDNMDDSIDRVIHDVEDFYD